jgi:hypothetical protein
MVSKVFEHPFDLTKVRLQSQVLDTTARFNGPIDCLVKTWKNEGIRGLYRVCSSWSLFLLLMLVVGPSSPNSGRHARERFIVHGIQRAAGRHTTGQLSALDTGPFITTARTGWCRRWRHHQFLAVSHSHHT